VTSCVISYAFIRTNLATCVVVLQLFVGTVWLEVDAGPRKAVAHGLLLLALQRQRTHH
jgi:hypothetical protein